MTAAGQIRAEGIDRLDLDEIAATLGVGPDAIRYWFNDETELLRSIMQIRQRWFLDEADARLAPLATNTEKLAALLELCVADHDVTYWIELWKLGVRNERARQARQTLAGGYRDLFARLIRAGQRSGEFAARPAGPGRAGARRDGRRALGGGHRERPGAHPGPGRRDARACSSTRASGCSRSSSRRVRSDGDSGPPA